VTELVESGARGDAHWSDHEVAAVLGIYGKHTRRNFHLASDEIVSQLGPWATPGAVRAMLLRRNLNPASRWCSDGAGTIAARGSDHGLPSFGFDDDEEDEPTNVYHRAEYPPPMVMGPDGSAWAEHAWRGDVEPVRDTLPPTNVLEDLHKVLFVPDTHRPYHDKRAWSLLLSFAHQWKPDTIVVLGDFADFYAVSAHDKDPSRRARFEDEIADVNVGLDELDAIGAQSKLYVAGNHEFRADRFVASKCPELSSLVSIPAMFKLQERGWKWTPYREHTHLGHLLLTHDTGNAGAYAHIKARDAAGHCAVIGHTHRMGVHYAGSIGGDTTVGAMFGCLLDFDSVDYMHRVNMRHWQLGFGTGRMDRDGVVYLQAHPIINYQVCVEGRLYAA
jgi:predicted phosphodiesterase